MTTSSDARPADHGLLVERVAKSVADNSNGYSARYTRAKGSLVSTMVRGMLSAYSTEHLMEMERALSVPGEMAHGIADQVTMNRTEELVVDTMRLYPLLGVQSYGEAEALLKSVKHYNDLPLSGSVSEAPDDVRRQSIALMKVTQVVISGVGSGEIEEPLDMPALTFLYRSNGSRVKTFMLANDSMVSLVMDHADRVDDICAIIRERGIADAQFIGGILDGIVPRLADGAL